MGRIAIIVFVGLLSGGLRVFAQQQTEIYIPIGESPGISGAQSDIGQIAGFDASTRTLSLAAAGETRSVRITGDTSIWLDRSAAELPNTQGSESDLVTGRRAEVKYVDPAKRRSASWIKIEVGS